ATRSIPTGWTSVGCVTDGGARALSYKYTSSSLTQESCISTCDTKGYIYAGLQYADECWCGNTLANGLGVAVTASQCNMACKGDSSEICGASYRITLFNKTVQTTTTTTTTATTTAAQTTSTAVATSGWALTQACAVDTSARILQGYHTSSSSNTQSWCQSICLGKDFTIAGVENGNECWCGNAVVGTPADGSASTCSYACAGDSSSKCGGNWRMQIYTYTAPASTATTTTSTTSTSTATTTTSAATATSTASSVWSLSQACAVDTSARILQGYHTSSSSNTQSWCQSTCLAKGFSIAGVENGNECWCGNAIIGTPADGSASTCSYACAGDSSSKCGGNWRMQIYTYTSPATTATTSGTSSTTTATTTTSAATSTASPGWALSSACVVDTSARILQGYNVASSSNTPAWCHSTCLAKGFIIAGVENGNECWCGNAIVGGTPTADSGSGCSYVCAGDSLSKCGGNWRMQVYTY
ncbi:WSC domain-containing protein, partial [Mycena latifolia]